MAVDENVCTLIKETRKHWIFNRLLKNKVPQFLYKIELMYEIPRKNELSLNETVLKIKILPSEIVT